MKCFRHTFISGYHNFEVVAKSSFVVKAFCVGMGRKERWASLLNIRLV